MEKILFKNGDTIPAIGLGTWLSKPDEVFNAVVKAVKAGYRHIDCAYIYKNETEIGEALNYLFSKNIVKREELFITSKLWNSFHAPDRVQAAIQTSLDALQLDYLDLYLVHWPLAFKDDVAESARDLISLDELPLSETWNAMIKLKEIGLAKHIGVSNFSILKLQDLISKTTVAPEVNQVELHPYFQQKDMLAFCQSIKIVVTAYSPLGSRHLMKTDNAITRNESIISMALAHNCTEAQIILAWGMQRGTVVIPKSVNEHRILENLGSLQIHLSEEEMAEIEQLNLNIRKARGQFALMPDGPYTYENLWDEPIPDIINKKQKHES